MEWYWWVVIGALAVMIVIDWLIIMGKNPKYWKGGEKK